LVVSASLLAQAADTSGADDDGAAGKENTGMDTGAGMLGCCGFGGKVVTMECWCWGAGWGGGGWSLSKSTVRGEAAHHRLQPVWHTAGWFMEAGAGRVGCRAPNVFGGLVKQGA
jgi:hypothetical protein